MQSTEEDRGKLKIHKGKSCCGPSPDSILPLTEPTLSCLYPCWKRKPPILHQTQVSAMWACVPIRTLRVGVFPFALVSSIDLVEAYGGKLPHSYYVETGPAVRCFHSPGDSVY